MKKSIGIILILIIVTRYSVCQEMTGKWSKNISTVLENTKPLKYPRDNRLPLYLWPAMDPGELDDASAENLVKELNDRGIGLICSWEEKEMENNLSVCLPVARAQKKLGLMVNIDASQLLYSFFNGDLKTAHIDIKGDPFFDDSFGPHKMGCPFALDFRKQEIHDRVDYFIRKYQDAGLAVDFIFTDWEIDGPLEVNRAYEASKKCSRCCSHLGKDFTFATFQKVMREMRSYLQYYSYSEPVLSRFPHALVGNYAVYPNDGYRYWYDYFEYYVDGQPYKSDQRAKYRQWYNDFPLTGFTYAMPVVYTWAPTFSWYDYENTDYRWFYNMLLVASNAGKSTPANIPVISFVHWNTIFEPGTPDPAVKQMSADKYQELLWHMLLRGTDTFFMWSEEKEFPEEVRLLHEVYAAAQQYGRFLDHGMPITFDVPDKPGVVISGLILGDQVLVRRTDFGNNRDPVEILAGTKMVPVRYSPGKCMVIDLKQGSGIHQ
jgi:hypothetical protein